MLEREREDKITAMTILSKTTLVAAALASVAAAVSLVPSSPPARRIASAPDLSKKIETIRTRHLPDLQLTDHDGNRKRFYSDLVAGKVVIINFMYASCSKTCELASQNLARLQDQLGDRLGQSVQMYSISLDTEHDTPAALAAYRSKLGARPGWSFLLPADAIDVTYLRRNLGVYEIDADLDSQLSAHTGMVIVGNEPRGRWSSIPSLVHPVRLHQAVERIILEPAQWTRGEALVQAVAREERDIH